MGKMKPFVNIPGVHWLKYDTRVLSSTASAILPLLFLFDYNMALLGVIFPIYFCPLQAKFLSMFFHRLEKMVQK